MKRTLTFVAVVLLVVIASVLLLRQSGARAHPAAAVEKQLYTCGMHPQIIQDKPGDCPICGMKLQPIHQQASASEGAHPGGDSMITIDPATRQTMGVRTGEVVEGPLRRSIRTIGVVDFNETALTDVTMKFQGWIEKLDVDATGREVKKGEPLFEAYSPDVYNSELEFASLTRSGNTALAKTTLERLSLLGVPAAELDKLKAAPQPSRTITQVSPADGVVIEKNAVEGMMFEPGQNLYRLADLSLVWLKAQIYEQDMAFVQLGQEAVASIDSLPGRKFVGRVTYVYPTLDPKTRTAQVRMEFHNPGLLLKPGMFAKVVLESQIAASATLVPESAVLRSGDRATVFVALDEGKFEPREIILGPRDSDARYQVLQGLSPGEKVVTSAQFLFDSESQLREAIQKMKDPGASPRPGTPDELENAIAFPVAVPPASPRTFICPMPEHANIEYEHGGKCPICSMTLIPGTATAQPASSPSPQPADHAQGNH